MSGDRILSTTRYQAGDGDAVQAFPLGGDTAAVTFQAGAARALTSAELPPEVSVFLVDIPAGRTLYVGRLDRDAALTADQKRAKWFPLVGGAQRTFVMDDQHQPVIGFLADSSGDLPVRILQAGYLGSNF